ncbi:hypothetical protein [Clostridium beijerinckii]|uniref:Uncharacterized protein n=1 Tax=Clostridium beijerinckii TaxID=1520 RepID=A0AAE5H7J7_CLOBE|nr:hypothetical protein [Clostridium beijerinckii]NSB15847.1 hypothetical protein [Clostridium beijerinckii]OOM27970.1 hypothetical protein CLOBE_28880 [Clostridium beijerinckii]
MYDKDIYEKAYYFELDRIDKIHARLTIPLTLLTLIGGAIINMLPKLFKMFSLFVSGAYEYISIIILIIVIIILFLMSLYHAFRSYFGYGYCYIDKWDIIDNWGTELNKYYDGDKEKVKNELDEYYVDRLKECRNRNFILNNKRQGYLFRVNLFICIQISLIIIAYTISSYINL